ncbi:MAG: hypothetical protein WBG54_04585 [Acidobacteriaceae bacterium]
MKDEAMLSLLSDGDQMEQETWQELQGYISLYETIWRLFSVPLRLENSIYFRDGIDPDLEMLAMCNYTAYANLARALEKIKAIEDDLRFSEEIWANLQRAVEVGKRAAEAFEKVYTSSTGRDFNLDRRQLDSAETQIKKYRNRLHDPVPATIKDDAKVRLIPKRELLDQYDLWTKVMYHARRDDFVTIEGQLRRDLGMACQALQSIWSEMKTQALSLLAVPKFRAKLSAGICNALEGATPVNRFGASGTIEGPYGPQSVPFGKR